MYDLPSLTKPISNAVIENVDEWEGNKMVVRKFLKKHAVDKGDYLSMMIVVLMHAVDKGDNLSMMIVVLME